MKTRKKFDPREVSKIKQIISFLSSELNCKFIATFDGWGWHFICNDFDGLMNPDFQDLFISVRNEFKELSVTFGFLGDKGVNILEQQSLLHGKKVITVKSK